MNPENKSLLRRIFVKEPWENIASAVIIIGVVMLLQPYMMVLYTYSFNFRRNYRFSHCQSFSQW